MLSNFNDLLESFSFSPLKRDLEKKFTMLVKNYDNTKWGKRSPFPCIVMEKFDGVCAIGVNLFGAWYLYSRTGRKLQNVGHLESLLGSSSAVRNSVVFLEICHDGLSLEEISGIVNPNRVEPLSSDIAESWFYGAYMGAFDFIRFNEFLQGASIEPFSERLNHLEHAVENGLPVVIPQYTMAEDEFTRDVFHDFIVDRGGEGTVSCLPDGEWIAGHKGKEKTKKVRGADYDLEVIGILGGKGKRLGTMAKVIVRWRAYGSPANASEPLAVDGRFTDSFRDACWADPSLIVGKVVHVHALQLGSKGALRLPKVRCVRVDKMEADL